MLVDTGATVNVLDECTFQQLLADKVTLKASSGVLCAFQTEESPTASLNSVRWSSLEREWLCQRSMS